MPSSELVPTKTTRTEVEVVCVRREGAYLRIADWCPLTLLLLGRDNFPAAVKHREFPNPAVGVIYSVEAQLPPKPVPLRDFRLAFQGVVEAWRPSPLPPPEYLPGPGEEIPVFGSESAMYGLIQSAVHERLSKESLTALAYLVRRAHGLGRLASR